MTSRDFCYWLQGFIEVHGAPPTSEQWTKIADIHLQTRRLHLDAYEPKFRRSKRPNPTRKARGGVR